MEALITGISGALGAVGAMTFFFIILRKDNRQLAQNIRQMGERLEAIIQREADRLSSDIQQMANRLSGDIHRETDRLSADIKLAGNRLREREGDMRVVKHQLQNPKAPHPSP